MPRSRHDGGRLGERRAFGHREGGYRDGRLQHGDDLVDRLAARERVRAGTQAVLAAERAQTVGEIVGIRYEPRIDERLGDRLGSLAVVDDDLHFRAFRNLWRRCATAREADQPNYDGNRRNHEHDDRDDGRHGAALRTDGARVVRAEHLLALGMGGTGCVIRPRRIRHVLSRRHVNPHWSYPVSDAHPTRLAGTYLPLSYPLCRAWPSRSAPFHANSVWLATS